MSFVNVTPEVVGQAAADLAGIGTSLGEANAAAALSTAAVLAPGVDEVSLAITTMLGNYAQEYQALSAQAANFHNQFVSLMNAGVGQYLSTEVANAQQALGSWVSDSAGTASGYLSGVTFTNPTVCAPAAAAPLAAGLNVGTSYQSLLANTVANVQVIENEFVQQTLPLVIQAATNPFGVPQAALTSLQTGSVQPLLSIPGHIAVGTAELAAELGVPASITSLSVHDGTAALELGLGLPQKLALDALGAPITGGLAAAQSATQLVDALATGNVGSALSVLADAPATVVDGFLNGEVTLSFGIVLPAGLGSATAEIPVAGVLAPLQPPFSVAVTAPALPFIDTITVTGRSLGGLVSGVNSGVQQIAGTVARPAWPTFTAAGA